MQPPLHATRPRWWTELPLLALVYGVYSLGRLIVRGDEPLAVAHGLDILRIEQALHINLEHPLNRLFTRTPALGIPADFVYASLHYLVTPAVLVWLFRRRPGQYRAARGWLMTSTMLGLIGFTFLPTCPPRLLAPVHGFTDTMAQYGSYGWWGADASAPRGLGGMTNQFAAMPSLHVGWALWCGVMLWRFGGNRLAKIAAVAYPLLITFVVMGTANHYLLDALAGVAVMGVGLLLSRPLLRLTARLGTRFAPASSATGAPIVSGGCETSPGERIPGQRAPSTTPAEADDGAASPAR
ncbi:phosphatase PAP2 family protein [Streptomyces sp. NPDC006692]|uniref:phosphatase PAP2 family protein n=1 Tax=unclassified Streptomyces TaxID=2593676 RepID=UPI0036B85C81